MNTVFLLMAEYETSQITLSVVAEKFLSISPSWADKKANLGELPFPTYRDNQKSGRLVHIVDLAEWIDKKRELAKIEFKSLQ
ncbi:TPA: pyocin activator PrtN family protein [Proteus mirabilis]|nr:pyocin activator PrtN family protein [Proteus mirabilis]